VSLISETALFLLIDPSLWKRLHRLSTDKNRAYAMLGICD